MRLSPLLKAALPVLTVGAARWRRHRVDGGGRGLRIMRSLVDRVHIATTAEGTTIRLSVSHPVQARGSVS